MKVHPSLALFATLVVCAATPPALGQPPKGPEEPLPLFTQVIKQPTGENGYEELVRAADLALASERWKKAEAGSPTLAEKRRVLADPAIVEALRLLRVGLAKPIRSPRARLDFETPLPELAGFRSLARLLKVQQYVYFADGRTADAIGSARICLQLGQAVQTDTLIAGLVGMAISTIGMTSLGEHLDQFAVRDCDAVLKLCQEWLQTTDPMPRLMEIERVTLGTSLTSLRQKGAREFIDGVGLTATIETTDDSSAREEAQRRSAEIRELFSRSPEQVDAVLAAVRQQVEAHHARQLAELQKPGWERARLRLKGYGTLAGYLAEHLAPSFDLVSDRALTEETRVRLLAIHAVIRRYRWEHERVPPDLATLKAGDLAVDPFTGHLFQYELVDRGYRLRSVGPPAAKDDPRAVSGRSPVTLLPGG
jgi:hypothetical protein